MFQITSSGFHEVNLHDGEHESIMTEDIPGTLYINSSIQGEKNMRPANEEEDEVSFMQESKLKNLRRKDKGLISGNEPGRTTDSVKLYLKDMGSVLLLTKEGEVSIAKEIERLTNILKPDTRKPEEIKQDEEERKKSLRDYIRSKLRRWHITTELAYSLKREFNRQITGALQVQTLSTCVHQELPSP